MSSICYSIYRQPRDEIQKCNFIFSQALRYADSTYEHHTCDPDGNKLTFTDRGGHITGYAYDELGRLTNTYYCGPASTCTADNAIRETGTEYDAAGRMTAQTDENGVRTEYDYDEAGRQTTVRRFLGSQTLETVYTYDDNGNRKTVTDPKLHTVTFEYDDLNRLVKTVFHDNSYTEVGYDSQGRKEYEYSQAKPGQTDRIVTKYEYDPLGRLTKVINDFGGPDQAEMSYGYDEVGNKISQTDPNMHVTTWVYDDLGRVVKRTLPEGMHGSFTYYPNGNLKTKTDFSNDTTTYAYYPCCGRLKTKTYQDGSEVSYTYTPSGRTDTVTDARGVTDHDYDFRGRLTRVENPDGTEISYTYYSNGNRKTVTVPSGTTSYTYDDLNRLYTVTAPDQGVTFYTYDDAGNRESVTYPNGTVARYDYDSLNRLTELRNEKSSGELISGYSYTLKTDGNREEVTETPANRIVSYKYDNLNRLTEEKITDPANGNETISYTYDDFGNRLTKTDSSGTVTYSYDDNDRLETETGNGFSVTYTYDGNGNTRTKDNGADIITYGYDYENRLVSADTPQSSVGYAYDDDGIRVRSTVDGVVTYYLADKNRDYAQILEETDLTGSLIASYVYGDDLVSQNRSGSDSFYHYDGLGSTRALTDDSAYMTDTYTYEAFGDLLSSTGTTENNYLFTGEQFDPNAGFYYLRARYYNQTVGRFVTADSWQGNMFESVTLHKYMYANVNPIMYVDPSGNSSLTELAETMTVGGIINATYTAIYSNNSPSSREFWKEVGTGFGVGALTAPVGGLITKSLAPLARPTIRPLLRLLGQMDKITLRGRSAAGKMLVKISRFFVNTNKHYPPVNSTPLGKLLKRAFPKLEWEHHHVWIQQAWSRAGSQHQLYNDLLANEGLRRIGNGLWNLLPIPRRFNNALGRSPIGTQLLATAYYSIIVFGGWHTAGFLLEGDD